MFWFCSMDMSSGFWVIKISDRARDISAFIKPYALFEWLCIPVGLKNASQIYQRLLDIALYGYRRISNDRDQSGTKDGFKAGSVKYRFKTAGV
ncbi:hypothetical protein PC128_g9711 [Phytophthora cactorum]|nr:hypothetical protein PC128_g9711 [Phytophthora cactorum]